MLARRFLWVIVGLVMLAFAAAVGYRLFGEQILKAALVPTVDFEHSRLDPAPDYRDAAMWLSRPGMANDPARWVPPGHAIAGNPEIAAFYVAPTAYLRRDRWNAPLSDNEANERLRLFTQTQASILNGTAQIWAPRYRQATFGAFLTDKLAAQQALDLAYRDVASAFDAFLANVQPGQPIILAGHSQGSLMLTRLLKDRIAGTPLARRIVAVYLGGWPVSVTADLPALGLPACTAPDQPGCILAWQSFAEPADPSIVVDNYNASTGLSGLPRKGTEMLCVNPLTGTQHSTAPAGANLGALRASDDLTNVTLEPGRIGARCADGLLLIGQPPMGFGHYILPGNNFHIYDYALFWANLRADVERRASAFATRR